MMTAEHIEQICDEIQQVEGFNDPPNADGIYPRPKRNHNPGDLRNWPGYPTDAGGFTIFPDDQTGRAKLEMDIRNHAAHYPEQTILEFIAGDGKDWPGYAPASDHNDSHQYAGAIARRLGVGVDTRFEEL